MLEVNVADGDAPWNLRQNAGVAHHRSSEFWIKAMSPSADNYPSFEKKLLACYYALPLIMDYQDKTIVNCLVSDLVRRNVRCV